MIRSISNNSWTYETHCLVCEVLKSGMNWNIHNWHQLTIHLCNQGTSGMYTIGRTVRSPATLSLLNPATYTAQATSGKIENKEEGKYLLYLFVKSCHEKEKVVKICQNKFTAVALIGLNFKPVQATGSRLLVVEKLSLLQAVFSTETYLPNLPRQSALAPESAGHTLRAQGRSSEGFTYLICA